MKQILLALLLAACLLLFTACHTDNDPWPTGDALLGPTATSVATEPPAPTAEPTSIPTVQPAAVPTASPTDIPGGDAAPGING